ncbi:MAG: hypothetical protein EPO07_14260 [Verrucomicrobia bacterium]|nr:MAG: hypothetical protein EPO07_14260 [Verrucomicrobiota bacterium]
MPNQSKPAKPGKRATKKNRSNNMKTPNSQKLIVVLTVVAGITFSARAHTNEPGPLVSVYATDPNNPQISYDEDPYLRAPEIPENPTVVYPDSQANALAGITDPYTAGQPTVTTGDPDTYSLSSPSVYYTPPTPAPGPYLSSGVPLKFDFGPGPVASGYTQVRKTTAYGPATGYGWGDPSKADERDRGSAYGNSLERDFCLVNGTQFYVDIPNGHYQVSVIVGDGIGKSGTAIRVNGLLELYNIGAAAGSYAYDSFAITVTGGRMMFEFLAAINHINAITITPIPSAEWNKPRVFLASDSTVASYYPGNYIMGWGQPLHEYFATNVVIDNQAKAGRSSKSFIEEGALDTIVNNIKPGDYLFVMFAINDSADDLPGQPKTNRKTNPTSTFKAYLRLYVNGARAHGATPVFVTGQIKCTYNAEGQFYNSVQGYPQAMRELGAELNVPVLELNKRSIDHLTAITPPVAVTWYGTKPDNSFDYIHPSNPIGGHGFAQLVAKLVGETKGLEALAQQVLPNPRPQPGFVARSAY